MAIQNEITRISNGKSWLRDVIRTKTGGVQPTPHQSLDDYAQIINNIDQGGIMTDEVKAIVNRTATSVTVPATVGYLRPCVFYGCTQLQEIVMLPTTPPTQGVDWCKDTNNCPIYVPDDSFITYRNSWSDLLTRIRVLSERKVIYDFSATGVTITPDSTKTRKILRNTGATLLGYEISEMKGVYLTSGSDLSYTYYSVYEGRGLYNATTGLRPFSVDTQGFTKLILHNGGTILWSVNIFKPTKNCTLKEISSDGKTAIFDITGDYCDIDVPRSSTSGYIASFELTY